MLCLVIKWSDVSSPSLRLAGRVILVAAKSAFQRTISVCRLPVTSTLGLRDSAGQVLGSTRQLDFAVMTALQRIATQAAANLRVEAVMKFDIGYIQGSPGAFATAEFNTISPQSIIVRDAILEKQTKRGKVVHGIPWAGDSKKMLCWATRLVTMCDQSSCNSLHRF